MASWFICSTLSTLVLYTVLCSYEAKGETDKYRDIHKRIFCNMAGCGNMVHGKRDYIKSKLYNMFNRPRSGKRSHTTIMESPIADDKVDLGSQDLDRPYSNWSPEVYDPTDANLLGSDYEDNGASSFLPNEDSLFYTNRHPGLDRAQQALNAKYRLLKEAEDLLHYLRSKMQRSKSTSRQTQDFNSDWPGKRK